MTLPGESNTAFHLLNSLTLICSPTEKDAETRHLVGIDCPIFYKRLTILDVQASFTHKVAKAHGFGKDPLKFEFRYFRF